MGSPAKKAPSGPYADKLWRDALRKAAMEQAEGKRGPRKLELAARKLVSAAVAGDIAAAKELGDRLDGKAHQTQDVVIEDRRMVEAPTPAKDAEEWAGRFGPH